MVRKVALLLAALTLTSPALADNPSNSTSKIAHAPATKNAAGKAGAGKTPASNQGTPGNSLAASYRTGAGTAGNTQNGSIKATGKTSPTQIVTGPAANLTVVPPPK
jgi:hypothetical protein